MVCFRDIDLENLSAHSECNLDGTNAQYYLKANPFLCADSIDEYFGEVPGGWPKHVLSWFVCRISGYASCVFEEVETPDGMRTRVTCSKFDGKSCLLQNFTCLDQAETFHIPLTKARGAANLPHADGLPYAFPVFQNSISQSSLFQLYSRLSSVTGISPRSSPIFRPESLENVGLNIHINGCRELSRFLTLQHQKTETIGCGLLGFDEPVLEEGVECVDDMLDILMYVPPVEVVDSDSEEGEGSNDSDSEEGEGTLAKFLRAEARIANLPFNSPQIHIPLETHAGATHGIVIEPGTLSCLKSDIRQDPVAQHSHMAGGLNSFEAVGANNCITKLVMDSNGCSNFLTMCDSVSGRKCHGRRCYLILIDGSDEQMAKLRLLRERAGFPAEHCDFVGCNIDYKIIVQGLIDFEIEYLVKELFRNCTVTIPNSTMYYIVADGTWFWVWNQRYTELDAEQLDLSSRERTDHQETCLYKGSGHFYIQANYATFLEIVFVAKSRFFEKKIGNFSFAGAVSSRRNRSRILKYGFKFGFMAKKSVCIVFLVKKI